MENKHKVTFECRLAKAELVGKLKTLAAIAAVWFVALRLLLICTEGVTTWEILQDSLTVAMGQYIPYRIGHTLTGTAGGRVVLSVVILLLMSTFWGDKEWLIALFLIVGYAVDFGPCICRLLVGWRR